MAIKEREKTLGENIAVIIITIAILAGLFYMAFDLIKEENKRTESIYECLTPIAKEFCENNSMVFIDGRVYTNRFYCFETKRTTKGEQFSFSLEEINNCKLFAKEVQE